MFKTVVLQEGEIESFMADGEFTIEVKKWKGLYKGSHLMLYCWAWRCRTK